MDEWLTATAADLGRAIEAGKADPVDLAEAFLDAIGKHPFADRIYARTTPERARAEAMAARERARDGRRRSPLDGVPISWKDLYDTAGVGTEAGTALLKGRVPERDAAVLATATREGTVCLGKTYMTELAFSGLGVNPSTASPPCINDHDAASGGSSSGAATSVAFGLAAAAIGSDTGGSIRIPAAWNDLVGFKPTHGRLSLEGVVPLCARFDTVGPLTRTVEDAALTFAALAGDRPVDLAGATLAGARLMVLETVAFDEIRDTPRAGFETAVDLLAAAGADITRKPVPFLEDAMALSGVLYTSEAYGTWRDLIDANPDAMYPPVRDRFLAGRGFSGPDFVAAWRALDELRGRWAAATQAFDAVILPTCPIVPPNLERLSSDVDFFVSENLLTLRNTRIGNLMGLPGLTLPTGTPSAGIMFLGLPNADERLLRLCTAAERALA